MANGNILVVEDDNDSREALCAVLEKLGYTPISFGDSTQVISGIKGQKLDLALLDIMMPKMNGYELLQELKNIPELKELPVIMVTAKDKDEEVLSGYQHGADYYITKPFTAQQLEYGIKIFLS
jgi:DNA-binding response OmpR family regulator